MATKGKDGGKFKGKGKYGKGSMLGDIEIKKNSTTQYEGALNNSYFVNCLMKDG